MSAFDLDLILVALAPELDLRYERLYAYLQDDVSRRRPGVDLALNLLCPSAEEKLARRGHFAVDAPLVRQGLIHLIPDPNHLRPPLLAHYLKLDDQIVDLLLGQGGLDARLDGFCALVEPAAAWDDLPLSDAARGGSWPSPCTSATLVNPWYSISMARRVQGNAGPPRRWPASSACGCWPLTCPRGGRAPGLAPNSPALVPRGLVPARDPLPGGPGRAAY